MNKEPRTADSFFELLERRRKEQEAKEAAERKDREDRKLERLRPWWLDAAQ